MYGVVLIFLNMIFSIMAINITVIPMSDNLFLYTDYNLYVYAPMYT
jgi:hypothetical protein